MQIETAQPQRHAMTIVSAVQYYIQYVYCTGLEMILAVSLAVV